MPSRIEELQAKAGEEWSYNTVLICADDLHCLLAVVEASRNLSYNAAMDDNDCMATVHMDYVDLLDIALAKLDGELNDA